VAILRIPASGSPTVPSSGTASRLLSSLRLHSTVPPRVQLRRQLAPPTTPLALLSCPSIDLRRSNEPSGLTFNSAVSLHRQLSFRFCCSCPPCDLRRPMSLQASPSIGSSAFAAARLPVLLPGCAPACAILQPIRLTFSTAGQLAPPTAPSDLPSCPPFDLRRTDEPSSLAFGSILSLRRRWNLGFCLPACRLTCVARPAFQPYLPT